MKSRRILFGIRSGLAAIAALAVSAAPVAAQGQTIKIGTLYDHSGPFSAAGSLNCWRGAKMMIDYINEKGGVLGKYKIVQVDGDSQSKAEVAINEAERLLNVEKVDILAGIYSSAHAVPLAEKVDKQKKFLWITTAIADAVLKDRNLQYTFRPQANGGLFGENSVKYVAHYSQDKLKKAPKDVRVAIIHEDGPYGTGVAAELAPRGIRVHAVNPGPVRTEGFPQDRLRGTRLDRLVLEPERVAKAILRALERDRPESYVFGAYRIAGIVQAALPGTLSRLATRRRLGR